MALRAIVKVSGSSTSANQLSNGLTAIYQYQKFQGSVNFLNAQGTIVYANITASIVTDADSKHQWYYDSLTTLDNLTINVTLVKADTLSFLDEHAWALGKGFTDTPIISESLAKAISTTRTDSTTLTDSPALNVGKTETDLFSFSDNQTLNIGIGKTDSFSHTDTVALSATKALTDSFPMGESLSRAVVFYLSPSDAFTVDDFFSGMNVGINKSNVFGFSDSAVFATAKVFSDTQGIADSVALSSSHVETDTLSITDSVDVQHILGSQGLFNAFVFNGITLNG